MRLNQFLENGESVFTGRQQDKILKEEMKEKDKEIEELHKTVGQLTVRVNRMKKNLSKLDYHCRKSMIDKDYKDIKTSRSFFVVKQCEILELNRSVIYYTPKTVKFKYDKKLIKAIKGIYDDICFYGHTKVHLELLELGFEVGLKTVRNIRNLLGIKAICVKPNTTKEELINFYPPP